MHSPGAARKHDSRSYTVDCCQSLPHTHTDTDTVTVTDRHRHRHRVTHICVVRCAPASSAAAKIRFTHVAWTRCEQSRGAGRRFTQHSDCTLPVEIYCDTNVGFHPLLRVNFPGCRSSCPHTRCHRASATAPDLPLVLLVPATVRQAKQNATTKVTAGTCILHNNTQKQRQRQRHTQATEKQQDTPADRGAPRRMARR